MADDTTNHIIPPNFRMKDDTLPIGLQEMCYDCLYLRNDPRFLCMKYLVYVNSKYLCDSFENVRKRPYPDNAQPFISREYKDLIAKHGILDLQPGSKHFEEFNRNKLSHDASLRNS